MNTYRRLLAYLKPYLKQVGLLVACTAALAVFSGFTLGMIAPFVKLLFYDAASGAAAQPGPLRPELGSLLAHASWWMLQGGRQAGIARLCWLILGVFLLKNLFGYLHQLLTFYIEQRITADLRDELYGHLQKLSLGFFQRVKAGQLISRLTNDVNLVRGAITEGTLTVIKQGSLVLVYAGLVFWASWRLALIAVVVLPLCIGAIVLIGRKLRKRGHRFQERMADVTAVLAETISGIRLVKTFAAEAWERQKFFSFNAAYFRSLFRYEKLSALTPPLTEFLGAVAGVLIILAARDYIGPGSAISPERFFLFLAAAFSMMQPLNGLSRVNSSVQQGLAASERLFAILDAKPEMEDSAGGAQVSGLSRGIAFDQVRFKYPAEKGRTGEGSADFELVIPRLRLSRGELLAVVGPSGAGKSTLADLIPRFYDPDSGTITWDGRDLRSLDAKSLRQQIGIVSQETILFHDTVFNNIAYGMPQASQESVEEAARAANAHGFIAKLPQGYQTMIGERGMRLSGGERQRISIARAILKNPSLLIFDEATSSLDAESEAMVQEAIDRLMRGRTALVIAHRLSTVKRADRIVVMENGRITESGKHSQLLARKGTYWRLYNLQFKA
jgi:subfamily B ATP-binding cassette protein MsbA